MIENIMGLKVIITPDCVEQTLICTRKQTRKFTNTRWVKKYRKKYNSVVTKPAIIYYSEYIMVHPALLESLKFQLREEMNAARQREFQGNDKRRECPTSTYRMGQW